MDNKVNSEFRSGMKQLISSRRRRAPAATSGGVGIPSVAQGIKMIFEHDSEEEEELAAVEAVNKELSSSSNESCEEDESKVRTDIIKFKKR